MAPSVTRLIADAGSSACVASGDGSHDLHVVGSVLRGRDTRLDCARPLRVLCRNGCSTVRYWRCGCSSAEKCPDCAEANRRRLARIVHLGLTEHLGRGLHAAFVTLTAPGTKHGHGRWIQGKRKGQRQIVCGCEGAWSSTTLAEWNADESSHWNRLRLALTRSVGDLAYIGAVEVQKRGALHRHVVVVSTSPLIPAEVQDLALAAGYGCTLDVQPIATAEKVAWYVSKYVTKSSGDRHSVPWRRTVLDKSTGVLEVVTQPTFRTWSASQSWGFTLSGLRALAKTQAAARAAHLQQLLLLPDHSTLRQQQGQTLATASGTAPP